MSLITKKRIDLPSIYDDGAMKIEHWLSAPTVDTDGEVIDGSAFDLTVHKAHPVLLLEHRRRELPIGTYRDRDGQYTLVKKGFPSGGNGLYGTCWFSKANPVGAITYGLYRENILSGFSAGFLGGARRAEKSSNGQTCYRYTSGVLLEGSATGIPANLDALATVVHKGRFAEERIPDDLMMVLKSRLGPKNLRPGWNFSNTGVKYMKQLPGSAMDDKLLPEFEEVRKSYGEKLEGYPGDAVLTEFLTVAKGIFAKGADAAEGLGKLAGILEANKLIEKSESHDDTVLKTLSDMAGRVDDLGKLNVEVLAGLPDAVQEMNTALEAKFATIEKSVADLAAKLDTDTTVLSDNLAALAEQAGLLKAA